MRLISFIIISFAVMLLILSCGEQQQKAIEDITTKYPENAKVIFENDYVRIVEFMLKPGDKLPQHKGNPRAVYALSDFKISWTEGDETSEKEWQKGDAHWHNSIEHSIENIGDKDANFIVISRKEMSLPEMSKDDLSQDASAIDPQHSNIIFENEHVRIIKMNIPPQESQSMHHGINRLIYALTDYRIKYISDKTETQDTQITAGSAHWHSADKHAVENAGTTPAQYLIFAFKK
jgi:quercetin dioxygenase-like cupin family protein